MALRENRHGVRKYRSHERSTLFPEHSINSTCQGILYIGWLRLHLDRSLRIVALLLVACKDDLSSTLKFHGFRSRFSAVAFSPDSREKVSRVAVIDVRLLSGKQWGLYPSGLPPGREWNCTCRTIYNGQAMRFRIEHSRGKLTESFGPSFAPYT